MGQLEAGRWHQLRDKEPGDVKCLCPSASKGSPKGKGSREQSMSSTHPHCHRPAMLACPPQCFCHLLLGDSPLLGGCSLSLVHVQVSPHGLCGALPCLAAWGLSQLSSQRRGTAWSLCLLWERGRTDPGVELREVTHAAHSLLGQLLGVFPKGEGGLGKVKEHQAAPSAADTGGTRMSPSKSLKQCSGRGREGAGCLIPRYRYLIYISHPVIPL